MLVRQFSRSIWNTLKVEKRFLASEPIKPKQEVDDGVEPVQADALDRDICLLVDDKDNFIGTATKRDCHKVGPDGSVLLHRAFSVFLFNKRGDMFMQRRSSKKVTYPDYYTNACCSHPLYIDNKPEDVITAARRRMNHELGIPLDHVTINENLPTSSLLSTEILNVNVSQDDVVNMNSHHTKKAASPTLDLPFYMDPEQFTFLTRVHYHDPGDGMWGEHEIDHILFFQGDVKVKPNSDEISEYSFVPKNEFNAYLPTLEGPITPWFNMIRRHRLKLWWDNLHRLKELAEPDKIQKFLNEK